jgi:uncharacterized protein YvpB
MQNMLNSLTELEKTIFFVAVLWGISFLIMVFIFSKKFFRFIGKRLPKMPKFGLPSLPFLRKKNAAATPAQEEEKIVVEPVKKGFRLPKFTLPGYFRQATRFFVSWFVLFSFLTGLGVFYMYFMSGRPYVKKTFPDNQAVYSDQRQPLLIQFDRPFRYDVLQVNTVPEEVQGEIKPLPLFHDITDKLNQEFGTNIQIPVYAEAEITPARTLPYEEKVVFYLIGIRDPFDMFGNHEHSYEIQTPKEPQITKISIEDKQQDVLPNKPITLEFDSSVTDAIGFSFESSPEIKAKFVRVAENKVELALEEPLKQGANYSIKLFKQEQVAEVKTGSIIQVSDPEILKELTFKTVTPPGIKSITPTGNGIKVTTPIVIEFVDEMQVDTLEGKLDIQPVIEGERIWSEDKMKLEIKPVSQLQKGTSYTITFKSGIKTVKGGETTEDINHKFETLGAVKVAGFSPWNGSRSVGVNANIRIDFDQAVDRGSAQSKVSISPGISADYRWEGNTLVIDPRGNMNYQTRYSVNVNPGIKSVDGLDSKDTFSYAFTTQSETVTLGVPRYTQGASTFDCNVVAARMALAYRGISVSNETVKSSIGYGTPYNGGSHTGGNPNADWIEYYGVHWDPIASFVRKYRGADVKRGWSLSGIASEIRNGNPVIIWWYNGVSNTNVDMTWYNQYGAKPGMHSVVVYGVKGPENAPTHIMVKDPWFSKETYTASEFNAKWGYFGRTGVVVR